jgi:hypothetical protein
MNAAAKRTKEMQGLLQARNQKTAMSAIQSEFKFTQNVYRNNQFFGREEIIAELFKRLDDTSGRQMSIALYGILGCGKSQVAVEYLYRYFEHYPVIIWLNGNDHVVLEMQFTQIARRLGYSGMADNYRVEVLNWITNLSSDTRASIREVHKSDFTRVQVANCL